MEAYTYRWNGHVGPEDDDHIGYRPRDEITFWKENDPIRLLEEKLIEGHVLSAQAKAEIIRHIDREIADAFRFAKESPFPNVLDWKGLNYCPSAPLAEKHLRDIEAAPFDQNQPPALPAPY